MGSDRPDKGRHLLSAAVAASVALTLLPAGGGSWQGGVGWSHSASSPVGAGKGRP
ncbi:hypothetical protein [Geodermatophilus sp. SYSU D01105]